MYNNLQYSLFGVALFLTVGSLFLFYTSKIKGALLFLFLASLALGLFMGLLDSYVNYWDEQYHMLVAKNMIGSPFEPMLYKNPVLGYNPESWTSNHIWLHKQPLFLWQMAISMKIFGVSPLAGRLPSIIMFALLIPIIFKIGKNMVHEQVGYIAALLFMCCSYVLEFLSGYRSTDHNDMAFLFYIAASMWAWTEYVTHRKGKWIILIGVFAGFAVLNKWLAGLLVYGGWGIAIITDKEQRLKWKYYQDALLAFCVSLATFLPWQIYTFSRFPIEANIEYQYNVLHFSKPVEDHVGDWTFHFKQINTIYGEGDLVPWILLLGLCVLLFYQKNRQFRAFTIVSVVGVYGFYTIAATKMISFTVILAPIAFLSFAALFYYAYQKLSTIIRQAIFLKIFMGILLLISCWGLINFNSISQIHTHGSKMNNGYKKVKDYELLVFDYLINEQPDTSYTFFNLPYLSNVPFMFHKNVHAAYDFCPNEDQYRELKNQKTKFVVYDSQQREIPKFILEDSSVQIIKQFYPN